MKCNYGPIVRGLHLFVGLAALIGGLAAIINPGHPLGVPADTLVNSPFRDFLIPGLILFFILGLGNIGALLAYKHRWKGAEILTFVSGIVLMVWIVVQCIMLETLAPPQLALFIIGGLKARMAFKTGKVRGFLKQNKRV